MCGRHGRRDPGAGRSRRSRLGARESGDCEDVVFVEGFTFEQCGRQPPAVVIDLDPGQEPINLDDPPSPAPGLADALEGIRNIGVSVLWLTAHPVSAEDRIRRLLRAVELDEGGPEMIVQLKAPARRTDSAVLRIDGLRLH